MGRLWAGHGPYGQVMGRSWTLWVDYRKGTSRLQVGRKGTGRLQVGHGPYGQVTGRLWAGYWQVMDLMDRLQAG